MFMSKLIFNKAGELGWHSFYQHEYILQFLTIDHDCPVPVDKHDSVKVLPYPI